MTKTRNPGPVSLIARTPNGRILTSFIVPRRGGGFTLSTRFDGCDVDVVDDGSEVIDLAHRDALIELALENGAGFRLLDRTKRGAETSDYPLKGYTFSELGSTFVRDGLVAIKCSGEAHSNPFIDNCGLCAPRWGVRIYPVGAVCNA